MSPSRFNDLNFPDVDHPPGRRGGGLQEEEFCQILNLKKNLDYSDVLIKYTSKYLDLGWHLVAVNGQGQAPWGLDFRQPQSLWSQKLMELGLEGEQVNLGVRTGAGSRLLVVEVHQQESQYPFNQRGAWSSNWVAQVGADREQHYFVIPETWQTHSSFFVNAFQIMVFGEGGLVLTPPSLEPQAQTNLRWLQPPWEHPPTQPSSLLGKFLGMMAPPSEVSDPGPPPVMGWEEVYQGISGHPPVLQALLAPAPTPEEYYGKLLREAWASGVRDRQVLMGLVWHAPLGKLREEQQGWERVQALLNQTLSMEDPLASPAPPTSPPRSLEKAEREPERKKGGSGRTQPRWCEGYDPLEEFFRASQENLIVERRRYEAMIFELGKLGAWQEIYRREHRENQQMREKLEAQWTREITYLRRLLKASRKP